MGFFTKIEKPTSERSTEGQEVKPSARERGAQMRTLAKERTMSVGRKLFGKISKPMGALGNFALGMGDTIAGGLANGCDSAHNKFDSGVDAAEQWGKEMVEAYREGVRQRKMEKLNEKLIGNREMREIFKAKIEDLDENDREIQGRMLELQRVVDLEKGIEELEGATA